MSISTRIKDLRKAKKLSQVQFSKLIQVSQRLYHSMKTAPGALIQLSLARYRALHVNLNWLLTASGEMFRELIPLDRGY
jgi:transcriptional regulator with XRE-family HTH domain